MSAETQGAETRTGEAPEPHPWYGSCDGFGPGRECSECAKTRFQSEDEWLVWLRSESPDEMASLRARLGVAERERDEARRDAERYRFLRDNPLQLRAIDGNAAWIDKPATTFDSHVDAALAARPAETPEGR